jgi:hypothetical protein
VKGRKEKGCDEYKKTRATVIKAKLLRRGICKEGRKKIKPYEEPEVEDKRANERLLCFVTSNYSFVPS